MTMCEDEIEWKSTQVQVKDAGGRLHLMAKRLSNSALDGLKLILRRHSIHNFVFIANKAYVIKCNVGTKAGKHF